MSWNPWAKSPSSKVTTYQQGKPIPFESLARQVQPPPDRSPASTQDLLTLTSSQSPKGQLLSKDACLNPTWMHMAYRKEDPVSLDFVSQMAEVGKVEGFHIVAHVMTDEISQFQKGLPKEASTNVTVTQNSGKHDAWSEDQGEFTSQGELIVPAIVSKDTEFDRISVRGRQKRYFALPEQGLPQLGCNFASMGLTNAHDGQLALLSSAHASGSKSLHLARSYVEGGNLFTGQRADGSPYALVGKDSVAITSAILKCDEAQAEQQIAIDYNLAPKQLISIEQPGSFHLDMSMAPGKPGQILLNDARQVANLQKQWLSDHFAKSWFSKEDPEQAFQAVDKAMAKVALHEDQTERELRQAGFEVIRVAGNFPESPANPPMNFLNLRQGTNDDGQKFAVSLGGTPEAEAAFVKELESKMPGHFYRIHFLDRSLTAQTLQYKGGVKCRTKPRV